MFDKDMKCIENYSMTLWSGADYDILLRAALNVEGWSCCSRKGQFVLGVNKRILPVYAVAPVRKSRYGTRELQETSFLILN